jgi:V8-like Glu-specific endopeptidase
MAELLDEFPLPWHDARIRGMRDALAAAVYREAEVVGFAAEAGISPADLELGRSARLLWTDLLTIAAGQQVLRALLDLVMARVPALKARLAELLAARPVVASNPPAEPAWKGFGNAERQIVEGQKTLLDVVFLEHGLRKAKAVCRFTVGMNGESFYGTGFRIGERTLLTNHHVLHDWDHGDLRATTAQAEFGYEVDLTGRVRQPLLLDCDVTSIIAEKDDDFAVITTAEPIPGDIPTLSLTTGAKVAVDDRVYIVQHPKGLPKKIGMLHNLVRHSDDRVVQYWTDTEAGSSGSPVFDEQWQVVALHHMAVPVAGDTYGHRNQGRAIARVADRLAALGVALP